MIPNRMLHIVMLTVLMGVSQVLGFAGIANAQRADSATQWHVALPDVEGNDRRVKITFVESGIRVHQTCTPFTAVWGQGDKVQIDYADNHVMCLVTPDYEVTTAVFFTNLKAYYASDADTVILMTRDNELIEATRLGPAPKEGQMIWR